MYIELYMEKQKPVMVGRRKSSQENNIKMDLGKFEGGCRTELTAFSRIDLRKEC